MSDRQANVIVAMVLIVACIVQAAAVFHASEQTKALTSATYDLRDVHDSYVAATEEQNNAAGKYHAAAAELSRINKLLEQTYGRSQR